MKFQADYNVIKRHRRIMLEITDDEIRAADLTDFDRLVLRDCDGDDRTISDRLLGLETLARAIERSEAKL